MKPVPLNMGVTRAHFQSAVLVNEGSGLTC